MPRPNSFARVLVVLFFLTVSAHPASARLVAWLGHLAVVTVDTGSGVYAGGVPGPVGFFDLFGYFTYPLSCEAGCTSESISPDETHYDFDDPTSAGFIAEWAGPCPFDRSVHTSMGVANDWPADQAIVDRAATLGTTLRLGQPLDVVTLTGETGGEGSPAFVNWNVRFVYAESNPLADTGIVALPRPYPDLVLFELDEGGGSIFSAFGDGFVPEPGFGLLLATGCVGLGQACRHKRWRKRS